MSTINSSATDRMPSQLAAIAVRPASRDDVKALLQRQLPSILQQVTGMSAGQAARHADLDELIQARDFRVGGVDHKARILGILDERARAGSSGRYGLIDVVGSASQRSLTTGLGPFLAGVRDLFRGEKTPVKDQLVRRVGEFTGSWPSPLRGLSNGQIFKPLVSTINHLTRAADFGRLPLIPGAADERAVRSYANEVLAKETAEPEYAELRARIRAAGPVDMASFARVYNPANPIDRRLEATLDAAVRPSNSIGIVQAWQTLSTHTERSLYDRVRKVKQDHARPGPDASRP